MPEQENVLNLKKIVKLRKKHINRKGSIALREVLNKK